MTPSEATKLVAIIRVAYGDRFKALPGIENVWSMALAHVPYRMAEQVVTQWIRDQEWPPVPANIIEMAEQGMSPLPGVDEAWRMVRQRIASTYPGHPAENWNAPAIVQEAAGDVGGLRKIRFSEQPQRIEQEFREAYRERYRKATREAVARGIGSGARTDDPERPGLSEGGNR